MSPLHYCMQCRDLGCSICYDRDEASLLTKEQAQDYVNNFAAIHGQAFYIQPVGWGYCVVDDNGDIWA